MEIPVPRKMVFVLERTLVFIALFSVDDCVSSDENLGSVSCMDMANGWGGTITMETVLDFQTFTMCIG